MGQLHPGHAAGQVALVQPAPPLQLPLQVAAHRPGWHDHEVLVPLAAADDDLPARQVHVLDAQLAALQQAEAAAVQESGHQAEDAVGPFDMLEDRRYLRRRQDHGQPFRPSRPHRVDAAQVDLEHLLVQKQERRERLILRAGRDAIIDGQVSEKLLDLGGAPVTRVPLAVEEDEACDPLDVAGLGAQGVVADAQDLAHLVEQAGRPWARQLAEVQVQYLPVEEVEGVAVGGDGPHRVFLGAGHRLQELAHFGQAQVADGVCREREWSSGSNP